MCGVLKILEFCQHLPFINGWSLPPIVMEFNAVAFFSLSIHSFPCSLFPLGNSDLVFAAMAGSPSTFLARREGRNKYWFKFVHLYYILLSWPQIIRYVRLGLLIPPLCCLKREKINTIFIDKEIIYKLPCLLGWWLCCNIYKALAIALILLKRK